MEPPFDKLDGVISTTSGYTGGKEKNPTYEQVSQQRTGHCEAVQIVFDSSKVTYPKLLDTFWRNIDPTVKNRQFADVGPQYRTGVFYHSAEQKQQALESKRALEKSGVFKKPIVVEILQASEFYPAEEYHQDYYIKNPAHYKQYHVGSGRARFIKDKWGERAH